MHGKTVLLTGSMTARQKRDAYEKIQTGYAKVVIGTHALIQDKVILITWDWSSPMSSTVLVFSRESYCRKRAGSPMCWS